MRRQSDTLRHVSPKKYAARIRDVSENGSRCRPTMPTINYRTSSPPPLNGMRSVGAPARPPRPAIDPADEAWRWTPGWQAAGAEAGIALREGRTRAFETMDKPSAEIETRQGHSLNLPFQRAGWRVRAATAYRHLDHPILRCTREALYSRDTSPMSD